MRKRNKRFSFLALCLSAIMLLGALPLSAGAWSEPDWRKYNYLADVPEDEADWRYDGIYWCVGNGVMTGKTKREFEPDSAMTRAEFMQVMYSLMTNLERDMTQGMYNFAITRKNMCVLPPHHTFCSTVNFVGHLAQGACLYLSSGLRYILSELKEQQPTHLVLVPLFVETFYKKIWQTAEKTGKDKLLRRMMHVSNGMRRVGIDVRRQLFKSVTSAFGGKLEMIICGGAALPQKVIDTFDALGITILNGYGITECSPLISCNRNRWQKQGSVGVPIIGEEVKIADPDANGEGEICVKGPNVMLGYYKDPEATAAAFDDEGFFKTGDYGRLDEDGWIYITGRLKNLIIFSNGKNVYPEEIETEISGVRGVKECVVYAGESRSDPQKEIIVAEIYPDEEELREHGITDFQSYFEHAVDEINHRSVSYKRVGLVKLRDTEFEKNTSKKIIRFLIDRTID